MPRRECDCLRCQARASVERDTRFWDIVLDAELEDWAKELSDLTRLWFEYPQSIADRIEQYTE